MKKTITIPANVMLSVKQGEEVKSLDFSFATFMAHNPLASNSFGTNLETLERTQQLLDVLNQAKPGDQVEMDADMWETCDKLVNNPSQPYQPLEALQLLSFFRALRNAV